jgi:hypothetical protein
VAVLVLVLVLVLQLGSVAVAVTVDRLSSSGFHYARHYGGRGIKRRGGARFWDLPRSSAARGIAYWSFSPCAEIRAPINEARRCPWLVAERVGGEGCVECAGERERIKGRWSYYYADLD